jgi:hypothetical protein
VNPSASVVTHRATEPIATKDIPMRGKDLRPWLSSAIRSDGRKISIVKTMMTSACEKDCFYCATRRGRNSLRRETFKPEELAAGFNIIHKRGLAEGLFLSSGVIGGGTRTMEKTIAAVDILRRKYEFRGYVHLKLMPGAERAAVERAMQLADRVSVNLEAPNTERLRKLSGTKAFTEELLAPLRAARDLIRKEPALSRTSIVTQFVVGAAQEDRDLELAPPVLGGLGGLLVEEDPESDEGERHEQRQDHREVHREVASQTLAELGEDVAKLHCSLSIRHSCWAEQVGRVSSGSRRRPGPGRARRDRPRAR